MGIFGFTLLVGAACMVFALTYALCRVRWRPGLALRVAACFVAGGGLGALAGTLLTAACLGSAPAPGSATQLLAYGLVLTCTALAGGVGLVRLGCRHSIGVRIGSRHPVR